MVVITQNHDLTPVSFITGLPITNIAMEWGAVEISEETYTNVSDSITEIWTEIEVATSDPWAKQAA